VSQRTNLTCLSHLVLLQATEPESSLPGWYVTPTDAFLISSHLISGMVGAINAPATGDKSFAAFQAAAKATTDTPGVSPS
jgi:hypothetical protein